MSKYIKLEDAIERLNQLYHGYEVEEWLNSLPTIEVSEDCISRKHMLEKAQEWKNMYSDNVFASVFARDALTMLKIEIENAPSVVPDFKTFCGVPIEEAIDVLEKYKSERRCV